MRANTSASQACGSTSFILAVVISVAMTAARSAPRSEPANSHDLRAGAGRDSRRNRHADTKMLLTAIDRLESAIRGERTAESVDRIRFDLVEMAKAIARTKAEIAVFS
jgi:uncharacterized protein YcbK (DUF882 family)